MHSLFMMPGGLELAVIVLLAVLLFGANKLPALARAAGQSMGEFHKGRKAVDRGLFEIRQELKPEAEPALEVEPASD
jgi:sec-independent protein translocase protein TatA